MSFSESLTKLLGVVTIEYEFPRDDDYHVYHVTLKVIDGFTATGISRKRYRALGYALRDIAEALISSGR